MLWSVVRIVFRMLETGDSLHGYKRLFGGVEV